MAKKGGGKGGKKEFKKPVWKYYKIESGKIVRLRKFCPICGPGVFMAKHKDRWACGRCGYTEPIK